MGLLTPFTTEYTFLPSVPPVDETSEIILSKECLCQKFNSGEGKGCV